MSCPIDSLIADDDVVVLLVAHLDSLEDGYRLCGGGLVHHHRLKASLQGGVPLHVFAIVVQSGGPDALELAPSQGGLEYAGSVHRALGRPRPHHGVHLVYKQHAVARATDLLHYLLEPFLELATILGARHQGSHVQGHQPPSLEGIGYVSRDDALGQCLDDGRLAHARLAYEHRVVLGAPAQDLYDPLDLLAPADDWIELVGPSG